MIMPTIKSLEALAQFSSREEAFNHFKDLEDGAIPPILPKFIKKDGAGLAFYQERMDMKASKSIIQRITASNGSVFTGPGTNSY